MEHHTQPAVAHAPDRRRKMKSLLITLIVLSLIILLLWFWRASRNQSWGYTPAGPIDVVATQLKASPLAEKLEAVGNVRAVKQVTLASETTGRVMAIHFDSGQSVKTGEILVQLDDAVERADLASARAAATFARQQFLRASKLAATGAVSTEVLQQRQSERDQSSAQVMQLEARIRQKAIRAPFDGQLGVRQVDPGQYLSAGSSIATLTDLRTLYVDFTVPQQELSRLKPGLAVTIATDTQADAGVAHIEALEPQVNQSTRNVSLRARLDDSGSVFYPGMYVTAAVQLPAVADALLVPVTAIMTSPSGDAVIAVRGDAPEKSAQVEFVPVTAGRRIGDRVVITAGVTAGDLIVTEGQLRIQPGAQVRVVKSAAAPEKKE